MSIDDKKKSICEQAWNECLPMLRKLCHSKMQSDPSEIDDVISQTFTEFLEAMNKDTNITHYKAYIFKICERNIIRYRSNNKKWVKYNVSLESTKINLKYGVTLDAEVAEEITEAEFFKVMHDILSDSEILFLEQINDKNMKYKDIAKLYHTTESAIKQKKYRISRDFKKALNDYKKNK